MTPLVIGARGSKLSLAQTNATLAKLKTVFTDLDFSVKPYKTKGDTDKTTSLQAQNVADDFFTDTLDRAVLGGEIDAALHSAKDLPDTLRAGLDWLWLPWREDARDALILPADGRPLPASPVVGVSSASREAFAKRRWPGCQCKPIRGDIEDRIRQLDAGAFDVIILAVAGLKRLGLQGRVSELVPLADLPTHEAQGALALTWKKGHPVLAGLRRILTYPVLICGAGTGREGNYSVAVAQALKESTLCLHDALMSDEILGLCGGRAVHVGKRHHDGNAVEKQRAISTLTLDAVRRGERVVRLKGGDPSLFARLAEELESLSALDLPYRILPGIPWLCSAPARHGLFLTERNRTRHFLVATGTTETGEAFDCERLFKPGNPIYFFMAVKKLAHIVEGLQKNGYSAETPAMLLREEEGEEHVLSGTLADIAQKYQSSKLEPPLLFVVGENVSHAHRYFSPAGPLQGLRVLIPGSDATRDKVGAWVRRLGGKSLPLEVFKLEPIPLHRQGWINEVMTFDWIFFSSSPAVLYFMELLGQAGMDVRGLPRMAASGPAVSQALLAHGIKADYQPQVYTSRALAESITTDHNFKGLKVLIPRSNASESTMQDVLTAKGASARVVDLYRNIPQVVDGLEDFDAVVFCSPSSVRTLLEQHGEKIRKARHVVSIGPVTTAELVKHGLQPTLEPWVHDVEHMMLTLAGKILWGGK